MAPLGARRPGGRRAGGLDPPPLSPLAPGALADPEWMIDQKEIPEGGAGDAAATPRRPAAPGMGGE